MKKKCFLITSIHANVKNVNMFKKTDRDICDGRFPDRRMTGFYK